VVLGLIQSMPSQISLKYAFSLGRVPQLSKAEIIRVLEHENMGFKEILSTPEVLLLEVSQKLNVQELQERLGGTIKVSIIKYQISNSEVENSLIDIIIQNSKLKTQNYNLKSKSNRFQFGFSLYGNANAREFQKIGLKIKKQLKEEGINSRFVVAKEKALSSVIVNKERLIDQGADIVIIENNGQYYLGQTMAVQDYHGYSARDYGRPNRDDKSGMLPPKLAKIMINLAGINQNDVILDPFCGSGTILQEALLFGYKNIIGSDISEKAMADSQNNLNWLKTKYGLDISGVKVFQADARNLPDKIKVKSIDAIVTEPYLGPSRSNSKFQVTSYKKIPNSKFEIPKIISELSELYLQSFQEFYKILKPGGRIVIILPIINGHLPAGEAGEINILSQIEKIGFQIEALSDSQRKSIVYGRQGQRVEREIFLLRKH